MPIVRWLHVSDLHLNKTGVESTRIRKNLPIYLKSLGCKFDYVFCSGDLRYAPVGRFSEDCIVVISNWDNYTDMAKELAKESNVGVFSINEFMVALGLYGKRFLDTGNPTKTE